MCDKCYRYYVLRYIVIGNLCHLFLCRKCVEELFSFNFENRDHVIETPKNIGKLTNEVVSQLLEIIKDLEGQVEHLTLENTKLRNIENPPRERQRNSNHRRNFRLEEVGTQDQNNLRIHPIGYRDNDMLNIDFLIEFPDGFKLPIC